MKIFKKSIFALVLSVVIFIGCSDDSENNVVNSELTSADFQFVGIEHNKRMSETFDFLKNQGNGLKNSKESLMQFLIDQVKNSEYSGETDDIAISNIRKTFSEGALKSTSITNFDLSEGELIILEKLDKILDADLNDDDVLIKIKNLEKEIESTNFSDAQLIVLYSATQTAQYSYEYWSEHIEEWKSLDPNSIPLKGAAKDIAKGDVAGAVGGAVGAAVVNVIPGLGQVAYGSAVVGSGVAGSVGVAVYKLMEWW